MHSCMKASSRTLSLCFFFFNDTATTEIYTLSLHDALPIFREERADRFFRRVPDLERQGESLPPRSEEHTSELQSQSNLVCRLLLEKKKKLRYHHYAGLHLHLIDKPLYSIAVIPRRSAAFLR